LPNIYNLFLTKKWLINTQGYVKIFCERKLLFITYAEMMVSAKEIFKLGLMLPKIGFYRVALIHFGFFTCCINL